MPKNKIGDLRDHLFAQLEALRDTDANLDQEITRARAVADVAKVLIESAKVEVQMVKATGAVRSTGFIPDLDEPQTQTQRRFSVTK